MSFLKMVDSKIDASNVFEVNFADKVKVANARSDVLQKNRPSYSRNFAEQFNELGVIPAYQRDYAWGFVEVMQYLQSVDIAFESGEISYALGDCMLYYPALEFGGPKDTHVMVDSQQRNITTFLTCIILRDLISEVYSKYPKGFKEFKLDPSTAISKIQEYIQVDIKRNGKYSSVPVLSFVCHPRFNNFIAYLVNNVGCTTNMKEFEQKWESDKDTNIIVSIKNMKFIQEFFRVPIRGTNLDEKDALIRNLNNFTDFMMNCVYMGVIEYESAELAYRAYAYKNIWGRNMSQNEKLRYYAIAINTPEEDQVKYGKLWNDWVEKYRDYAQSKNELDYSMGLISLCRTIFKVKYTNLSGGHDCKEPVLYSSLADVIVRGNPSKGIEPNSIMLVRDMEKLDKMYDKVMNLNEASFSEVYRKNFIYLKNASSSNKWLTALIYLFDVYGDDAYSIVDEYITLLTKTVMYMMLGKGSKNLSLVDDTLDFLIYEFHRRAVVEKLNSSELIYVMNNYVKNKVFNFRTQVPANATNFDESFKETCNNLAIKRAVMLGYEFLVNPSFTNVYKDFNVKEYKVVPILDKSGENLESGVFADMSRGCWCNVFTPESFEKQKKYKNSTKIKPIDMTEMLSVEVAPIDCGFSIVELFKKIFGGSDRYTEKNLIQYRNTLSKVFKQYLGLI